MKNDGIECVHLSTFGCRILVDKKCVEPEKCSFRKTERQFIEDENRRIKMCRERGLCSNICQYREQKYGICEFKEVPR